LTIRMHAYFQLDSHTTRISRFDRFWLKLESSLFVRMHASFQVVSSIRKKCDDIA
jgi:hypothetical protein